MTDVIFIKIIKLVRSKFIYYSKTNEQYLLRDLYQTGTVVFKIFCFTLIWIFSFNFARIDINTLYSHLISKFLNFFNKNKILIN